MQDSDGVLAEPPAKAPPPGRPGARAAARPGKRVALRVAGAVLAVVVVLGLLAEAFLPGIAAERVRSIVGRYGPVRAVSVSATPAVELLWGDAERISVRATELRISPADLVRLEQRLRGVQRARLDAQTLELLLPGLAQGGVALHDVRLTKDGRALVAHAFVRAADLHVRLPAGLVVTGLDSVEGAPEVAVAGGLAGVRLEGRALVSAEEGAIVVRPVGIPLAGLVAFTLLSDPRIAVEDVSAAPLRDGYAVTIRARQTD